MVPNLAHVSQHRVSAPPHPALTLVHPNSCVHGSQAEEGRGVWWQGLAEPDTPEAGSQSGGRGESGQGGMEDLGKMG